MVEPDEQAAQEPLVQPRLVRFLKNRRKLIKGDVREEFLEELEKNIERRRMPDTAAERMVESLLNRSRETVAPVASDRAKKRASEINEKILKGI